MEQLYFNCTWNNFIVSDLIENFRWLDLDKNNYIEEEKYINKLLGWEE